MGDFVKSAVFSYLNKVDLNAFFIHQHQTDATFNISWGFKSLVSYISLYVFSQCPYEWSPFIWAVTGVIPSFLCTWHVGVSRWVTHTLWTCFKGTATSLSCANTASNLFLSLKDQCNIMLSYICVWTVRSTLTCANTTTAWPVTLHLPSTPSCVIRPLPMATHWTRPSRQAWTTPATPSSRPSAWWQETRRLTRSDITVPFPTHQHTQTVPRCWVKRRAGSPPVYRTRDLAVHTLLRPAICSDKEKSDETWSLKKGDCRKWQLIQVLQSGKWLKTLPATFYSQRNFLYHDFELMSA